MFKTGHVCLPSMITGHDFCSEIDKEEAQADRAKHFYLLNPLQLHKRLRSLNKCMLPIKHKILPLTNTVIWQMFFCQFVIKEKMFNVP